MVTPKGLVKVLDFGLAKVLRPQVPLDKTLTLEGSLALTGTLPFMAPEQLQGGEVDARTDIHALGAVLHQLATQKRPFPQETPTEVMQAILHEEPRAPRSLNARISEGLDPFTDGMTSCIGWHCLTTREYDEAIQYAQRGLAMNPKSSLAMVYLGWAYEQKSMLDEAIAQFKNALAIWENGSLPLSSLAHAYAISGRTKEARDILGKLLEMSERTYIPAYDIAVVHLGLGEKDHALEWLNKAFSERSGFLVYIKCDRRFDALRGDPRWEELLRRTGLPPDGETAGTPLATFRTRALGFVTRDSPWEHGSSRSES